MRLEELEVELMECAREMRRMTTRKLQNKMDGGQIQQHRRWESSLALQNDLHDAIKQGHNSTRMLQRSVDDLQHQIHQHGSIPTDLSTGKCCCSKMEDEVERWKGLCKALQEEEQRGKSIKVIEPHDIERELQTLRDENSALRRKLEKREKELNGWKEDCMFFAVKFMSWGPSLLKWGPALHHEFELKLLQKRKKRNSTTSVDRKLRANFHNVAVGSLRSTFTAESVAVADLAKDCNPADRGAGYWWTDNLWIAKKRKYVSRNKAIEFSCISVQS